MTIEVRQARPEEYEEAGRVTAMAYREFVPAGNEDWQAYLRRIADVAERARRTTILVAAEGGRILGSATLELSTRTDPDGDRPLRPEEAHVRMLGVDPDARRQGVARALMDACLELAGRAGKTLLTLHTTGRMRAAQGMYESLGFERGEDRVFPDGFVLLSYSKTVAPPAD